jgi:hypothetical protein
MAFRLSVLALAAVVLTAAPAAAQGSGFGIGPRLTFVRGGDPDADSQRFTGAAIRLGGGKTALEVAMDFRSTLVGEDLTERVKDYPIQASLLIFPVRTRIAPYLLGGLGWYSQRVESLGPIQTTQTTRKLGYHAGFGGELFLHRRFGIYGDYRYTFIHFGGEDSSPVINLPLVNRLKMSHEGSMFTWGANFYF